ncbi:MAG: hypothetical protein COA42_13060 [Alteromonadaceae bacterium]|nr:MAG: hypothetical protein COA42_13060 [Alteromonadaceae bacterium]
MKQLYYISPSLDKIEQTGQSLKSAGFNVNSMHVLTDEMGEADKRQLNPVSSLNRNDIIRWIIRGFLIGCAFVALAIVVMLAFGGPQSLIGLPQDLGWLVMAMMSAFVVGFCSWEAGLLGLHRHNHRFATFEKLIAKGQHVFFVDVDTVSESQAKAICDANSGIRFAGFARMVINPFARGSSSFVAA